MLLAQNERLKLISDLACEGLAEITMDHRPQFDDFVVSAYADGRFGVAVIPRGSKIDVVQIYCDIVDSAK